MTETRPLTDPERRYLEWHVADRGHGGVAGDMVVGCLVVGAFTLIAIFAFSLVVGLLRKLSVVPPGTDVTLGLWLILGAAAAGWVAAVLWARRKRVSAVGFDDLRKSVQKDLAGGVARIHRFRATAVVLATRSRKAERNYFVRLEDGRNLYLGVWKPPACPLKDLTFNPDDRGFPSNEFEIATGPDSLLILEVLGRGDYLRPEAGFELRPGAFKDPVSKLRIEPGSLVKGAWEDLRKTYG